MAPTNDKPYISKADERYASNKDGQKTIVILNSAVSLSISVSPTIAEQVIIDDFDIKVSRGSSESRRRTLLVESERGRLILFPYRGSETDSYFSRIGGERQTHYFLV